jgi:hypothetical protein
LSAFTMYFDDSGTHTEASSAVAACFIGTVEQWKRFEADWQAIAMKEGFTFFHMADFAARTKEFKDWSEEKRVRVLGRLCSTIRIRTRIGIVVAVLKRDYDHLVQGDFRKYCGEYHYTFTLRSCMTGIRLWREKFERSSQLRYVFDRMNKGGKGEIIRVMDAALETSRKEFEEGVTVAPVFNGYSFEDSKLLLPLQAADILAWSAFQVTKHREANRPLHPMATAALKLLEEGVIMNRIYDEKERLARWVSAEQEARAQLHSGVLS